MVYPDGSRGITSPTGEFQYQLNAAPKKLTINAMLESLKGAL